MRQGCILATNSEVKGTNALFEIVKSGRLGDIKNKGVPDNCKFLVLTQDCNISSKSNKYIELAQLKKAKVKDESKIEHIILGKDYNKLILKQGSEYYELSEILITKVKKDTISEYIRKTSIIIDTSLDPRTKKIVLDWRLLTYLREPFPHNFNTALWKYFTESDNWFNGFLLNNQDNIHSIRFYVEPEEEQAAQYDFSICVLLTDAGAAQQDIIEKEVDKMVRQFSEYPEINCLQISDDVNGLDEQTFPENLILSLTSTLDEFTFANAYVMPEFNFQYLCY